MVKIEISSLGYFYYRFHSLRNVFEKVLMITLLIFLYLHMYLLVFLFSVVSNQLDLSERVYNKSKPK